MKYTVTFEFDIEGQYTVDDIITLGVQAAAQFDDPHDNDGERVTRFQTANLRFLVEDAEEED